MECDANSIVALPMMMMIMVVMRGACDPKQGADEGKPARDDTSCVRMLFTKGSMESASN